VCLPFMLVLPVLSSRTLSSSARIENRLCRGVDASVVVLVLSGGLVLGLHLKVCRPPLIECIVIEGGLDLLYDSV
jgi:hypothetical protein